MRYSHIGMIKTCNMLNVLLRLREVVRKEIKEDQQTVLQSYFTHHRQLRGLV
jgi:hypothetical protein